MNVKGLGQEIWGEIGAGSGVQWRCGGGGRMGFARRWEGTPRIGNPTIASGSRVRAAEPPRVRIMAEP